MSIRTLLGACFFAFVVAPGIQPAEVTAHLLLTEILYNAPGSDSAEEWMELANLGSAALELTGFKLGDEESAGDGEGMVRFPEGSSIGPGQVVLVAQTAAGFSARFGRLPDYELVDSNAAVPDMIPYRAWASGDIALANDGDEVLILDGEDRLVDAVSFGASSFPMMPAVAGVLAGQSIERVPADCDSDTALDWLPQRLPTPGVLSLSAVCRSPGGGNGDEEFLPIGQIQGSSDVSPFVNQVVSLRGVVTGFYEDRNSRGAVFYTMFVQDAAGAQDHDPLTSDGIAVFLGPRRPALKIGDLVRVNGRVTEFFGLTEIDDDGLSAIREGQADVLPEPITIDPPADNDQQAFYLEASEGMRAALAGAARVVGPTHVGCGFAMVDQHAEITRVHAAAASNPVGQVVTVLNPSDVDCSGLPPVKSGDTVTGVEGPLAFHFDRFKIVQQRVDSLILHETPVENPNWPEPVTGDLVSIVSLNLNNYFDTSDDTRIEGEPVPTEAEISHQRSKLAYQIGMGLACPTVRACKKPKTSHYCSS